MTDVGDLVIRMQSMLREYDRKDVYCALLTFTVNMIHAIDDKALRARFEREYIKALGFLSAGSSNQLPEMPH
jgi:hypothetical protein